MDEPDDSYEPEFPREPDAPAQPDDTSEQPKRFEAPAVHYLPRLWKEAPEPGSAEHVAATDKKKRRREVEADTKKARPRAKEKPAKAKKVANEFDDGTGATKLEETPVLDTYETRQRIRLAIGLVFGGIGLFVLVMLLRTLRGNPAPEPAPTPETVESKPSAPPRPSPEQEATALVETARLADKAGRTPAAVETLNKVVKIYPTTTGGRIATEALDRHRQDKPLFIGPGGQATGPKPPPEVKQANAASPPSTPGQPIRVAPGGAMPLADAPKPPKEAIANAASPPGAPLGPTDGGGKVDAAIGKPLPSGFHAKPGTTVHASGWPLQIVCDRDNAPMVLIPSAVFSMGRDDGEPSERPAHRVKLSTYYIDVHEVTVGQFQQYLGETGRPAPIKPEATPLDFPVVGVTAREAQAYCNWANRRLPTEAQWELAARTAEGKVSSWKGNPPRKDPAKGSRSMEPVMSLATDLSGYGVYDMGGNAWEWTKDWYDSQFYHRLPPLLTDPTGPSQSRIKDQVTVKGTSKLGILTEREGIKIEAKLPYLGFRGALSVDLAPASTNSKGPGPVPNAPNGGEIPF